MTLSTSGERQAMAAGHEPHIGTKGGGAGWSVSGEKRGVASQAAMTHTAIQEVQNGQAVNWLEHVTDAPYRTGQEA